MYRSPFLQNSLNVPNAVGDSLVVPDIDPNAPTYQPEEFNLNLDLSPGTSALWKNAVPAAGIAQGLFNSWLGMKQYGLAKKQFKEGKRQFNLNYSAQRNLTNSRLEDRQRARIASNPNAYRSVGDYMNQYGVK